GKESNDFLFPGKHSPKPLSEQSVRLILKRIVEQNGLSKTITPHMFRHSFATMLLDNDVDIRYIQQILGHSSISITQIYTHVSHSKQKEILSSFNPMSVIHSEIE
ncbi:TPA: tyrosine-type recombinase/integrase, partial [Streptococcus pneumoniae]|nr:tyrosine-type recombinase/integrase [Streptococcus pneumoniae]